MAHTNLYAYAFSIVPQYLFILRCSFSHLKIYLTNHPFFPMQKDALHSSKSKPTLIFFIAESNDSGYFFSKRYPVILLLHQLVHSLQSSLLFYHLALQVLFGSDYIVGTYKMNFTKFLECFLSPIEDIVTSWFIRK